MKISRTFCDYCGRELPNDTMLYHTMKFDGGNKEYDICEACYQELKDRMARGADRLKVIING